LYQKEIHVGAGGMTQEIEHLPGKCKALGSNPSTTNKEEKGKGRRRKRKRKKKKG
jgi:hypothetical protein